MRAHFASSQEPLKDCRMIVAACGAEVKNAFFALQLDTAFTLGHSVKDIVSANTLLFCRKCLNAPLEGRLLYAICEGQEAKDSDEA